MFPCKMDANPVSDLQFKWTFNNSENFINIKVIQFVISIADNTFIVENRD